MTLLRLAFHSLWNRRFSAGLTVLSLALSVALLLSVERAKRGAEEGFTSAISQTDLIVGARSGPIQLILYTVFNTGSATQNLSWESYQRWSRHPVVEWTIPYSLGDSHRGSRVVGTTEDFFKHYRYRGEGRIEFSEGKSFADLWDVVLGADVARQWGYRLGQEIVISHGATKGESFQDHRDKPFRVSGILKPTGTPIDQSLYLRLEGLEAIHMDWQDGAAPTADKRIPQDQIRLEDLKIHSITAFFLRTKSRIETLKLQREINMDGEEPLLAIIPGATLQDLWRGLSYVEKILRGISLMVIAVAFFAMLIALMTSLNERRREMAVLRSLGAGRSLILGLLVFESALLTGLGLILGSLLSLGVFAGLAPWLEAEFGLSLTGPAFTGFEVILLAGIWIAGLLMGGIPALRALRQALKDGLSVRL